MATTQYIGARYVPLFFTNPDDSSNNWKSGVAYDPLTVVTDLNQSYTSKIPVPASVGRPSENPTYWILTGNYDAQVAQYLQEVQNLTTRVDRFTDPQMIIIGDSWSDVTQTDGITKWPILFAEEHPDITIHNYARGGSSVAGADNFAVNGTMGGQVAAAIADTSFDHDQVKYIAIMGGVNDIRGYSGDPQTSGITLGNAFASLISRLKDEFVNAIVRVFINNYIPMTKNHYRTVQWAKMQIKAITHTPAYNMLGWIFTTYYGSDRIHPINVGHQLIEANVDACMFGGSPTFVDSQSGNMAATSGTNTMNAHFIPYEDRLVIRLTCTKNTTTSDITECRWTIPNDAAKQLVCGPAFASGMAKYPSAVSDLSAIGYGMMGQYEDGGVQSLFTRFYGPAATGTFIGMTDVWDMYG